MEITNFQLCLMILFNTTLCILLPRLLTLNWLSLFSEDIDANVSASQLDMIAVTTEYRDV